MFYLWITYPYTKVTYSYQGVQGGHDVQCVWNGVLDGGVDGVTGGGHTDQGEGDGLVVRDLEPGGTGHGDGVKRMQDGRRRQQLITFYAKRKKQNLSTLGLNLRLDQNENENGKARRCEGADENGPCGGIKRLRMK